MPWAQGCEGTANYLPYCRGATAGPQSSRLKAPTLGTLQTLPDESDSLSSSSVAETAGFSSIRLLNAVLLETSEY